jgi:hypothetical protein
MFLYAAAWGGAACVPDPQACMRVGMCLGVCSAWGKSADRVLPPGGSAVGVAADMG